MSPTLEIKNNNEKKRPITTSLVGVPSDSVKFETDNQQTTTPKKPRGLGSSITDDSPLPAFSPEQQKLLIHGLNLQEAESLDDIGRKESCPVDGNCGYHAALKGLCAAGVSLTLRCFQLLEE